MQTCYFDHAATTPVDPRVVEVMLPCFDAVYGNPSSIHRAGLDAKRTIDTARTKVAAAIGADAAEIVFTSGGTEANNLALAGVANSVGAAGHLIISAVEHPSVIRMAARLRARGWAVDHASVDESGVVGIDAVTSLLRPDTALVSMMFVNNETGAIQPVAELGAVLRKRGVLFHVDAIQAFGKLPVDVRELPVDALTLSAHKVYGPKGAGALFVRKHVQFDPLFAGGPQERKRRPGTENVAAIAGFGRAAELAVQELEETRAHLELLSSKLRDGIAADMRAVIQVGRSNTTVPGIVAFAVPGQDSLSMLMRLDLEGIAVSNGSACSSGQTEPSHVLRAMGLPVKVQQGALRVSFGRGNTEQEVARLEEVLRNMLQPGSKGRHRPVTAG